MANRRTGLIALAVVVAAPIALQKLWSNLGSVITQSPLIAFHNEPVPVGVFTFKGEDGVPRRLADFRGQFLLVNVWATWCAPCREEMPSLDRLTKALASSSEIRVIAISVDSASMAQVRAFYTTYKISHLPLLQGEQDDVLSALGVGGLPTTLLLNRDSLEVGRLVGPTAWDSTAVMKQLSEIVNGTATDIQ